LGHVDQADTKWNALESLGADGTGLRVDFDWREDRYGHQIASVHDPEQPPLLVARLEGALADWPDSPPLQQISWMEPTPGRRIALLVGMAGKSHWSVSVETDSDKGGFLFDVACRVHRAPDRLGSVYRCQHPVHCESRHTAHFAAGDTVVHIISEPTDNGQPAALDTGGNCLSIQPALDAMCAPCTIRWKYRIATTRQTKQHEH
jgi:hypothetical protein